MKLTHTFYLLLFSSLLLNSKCKKDNEPQLPPETTIGAMTFGCKIDGKVFVPKGGNGYSGIITEYPFLGNGPGGGWFLNIVAANRAASNLPTVSITTDSLLLIQGTAYQLKKQKGFAKGQHTFDLLLYQMWPNDFGELFITKHDSIQRILSGRFSFTASRSTGEKVIVTEGRFDIRY
ncbi:MAG: hypothetical protein K2Q24_05500 [Chitinophagaceae bacterium]|jgi:hypothetical protein|nr:hypothetical protein [Chitinophagaceae bacterium]